MKDSRIDQIVFSRWVFPRMAGMELSMYLALTKLYEGDPIQYKELQKYMDRKHAGAMTRADIFMESLGLAEIDRSHGTKAYQVKPIQNPVYINSLLNELYITKRIGGTELKILAYLQYVEQMDHDITIDQVEWIIKKKVTAKECAIPKLKDKRLIEIKNDHLHTTFI